MDKIIIIGIVAILVLGAGIVSHQIGTTPDDVTSLPACSYSIVSDTYHQGHWVDTESGCVTDLQVRP